jgi:hypothetical protein
MAVSTGFLRCMFSFFWRPRAVRNHGCIPMHCMQKKKHCSKWLLKNLKSCSSAWKRVEWGRSRAESRCMPAPLNFFIHCIACIAAKQEYTYNINSIRIQYIIVIFKIINFSLHIKIIISISLQNEHYYNINNSRSSSSSSTRSINNRDSRSSSNSRVTGRNILCMYSTYIYRTSGRPCVCTLLCSVLYRYTVYLL